MPQEWRQSSTVAAAGTARITLGQTGPRMVRRVRQVSTMAPNVGGSASCALYKNGMLITPMDAQGDAAVEPPPIDARSTDQLYVEWTGGTAGAQVEALFIYDEVKPGE